MARIAIPIHPLTRLASTEIDAATEMVTADSTDNHSLENDAGDVALLIINGSISEFIATIVTPFSQDGLALPDLTVTVAAGADAIAGPFPKGAYNNADGLIYVNAGATSADVKLAAIKF